jgi:mannan endo-1,4-beta-mannosidase
LRGWDFDRPVAQPVTALTDAGLPAPKLLEVDLTDFGVTTPHDAELFTLLLSHAAQGGLIGLSFHVGNPFTGGGVNDTRDVDLPQLADPAIPQTPAGARWKAELDRIADVMQQFADVDAVVLFRPLHESNGFWFWWGQKDPVDFRATWQGMFRYLTTNTGLHNLLWVYSANRNFGGALADPTRLYPGDDLVDIVGLDIYDDDLSDAEPGEPGYAAMLALGKPSGITEYGAVNDPPHDGAVHLPNDKVIRLIKQWYPDTVLATAWYSQEGNNWQISDKPTPQALLLDTWAITL